MNGYIEVVGGDIDTDIGEMSDGYHTFDELYEHRHALFLALMRSNPEISWKARLHSDGTMFEGGWFIAGMDLPSGTISYHLPIKYWDIAKGMHHEKAPEWDGHTASDVVDRLLNSLNKW